MEPTETPDPTTPAAPDRGRRMRSTIVAVGAALGMTLAGLGIAQAQTSGGDGPTTTAPPAAESSEPTPDGGPGPGPGRCHHAHPLAKAGLTAAAETIGVTVEELRTALEGGQSIAQVAESKDVAVQSVIDAMVAEAKEKLAEGVESGRLTQAQADERSENLETRITELVNREGLPLRHHHRPGMKAGLSTAAETIGVTVEELRTALEGGQSIAQVAESKGVAVQSVIDAMVAEAKEKLAEAVESGRLTQAQADERSENLEARITELVNREGLPARSGPGPRPEPTPTA